MTITKISETKNEKGVAVVLERNEDTINLELTAKVDIKSIDVNKLKTILKNKGIITEESDIEID